MTRILLATDYGSSSRAASRDAALLAARFGARLDLVHALPTLREPASRARIRAQGEARLRHVGAELANAGTPVGELRLPEGSAAEAILHTADELASDLVVLAAGDRSEARGTGPTAETVARFARQPVWVSRPRAADARRIVCGIDRSDASREALLLARDISVRLESELDVVHAVDPDSEHAFDAAELALFLGCEGRLRSEPGAPRDVLARASEGAFLLVLGRAGSAGLRRVFLGGTAERLLRSAPCSLLLTSPARK